MSYLRVIPRDLFNEAKLLKCLGALYIASETMIGLVVENEEMGNDEAFDIRQDESTGAIYVRNVNVVLRGRLLHCFTPLNSKLPYPLKAEDTEEEGGDIVDVFTDDGKLTAEFLEMVP